VLSLLILLSGALAKAIHMVIVLPLYEAGKIAELALITSSSLGLFFLCFAYCVYLQFFKKKKSVIKNYTFDEATSIYTHNETGQLFCGTCMLEEIESPLITQQYGWFCQRKGCSKSYPDPNNPKPPPKRTAAKRKSWIMDGVYRR
jgi:hypothetical protein